MSSKLTILLVVAALTGGLAYWLGYRQGTIACDERSSQFYQKDEEDHWRENGYHQARICLSALTNLNAGKQAEAGAILEQHLSEGIGRLVSTWENPHGDQFSTPQILLLRRARDYRLQHPWTNDEPERVERLEKAL